MAPTISLLMGVYNAEDSVSTAVESILRQDFTDFEVLIMDDGSTDGSLSILREFASRDARIRLFSRENKGLTASLNELAAQAQGELIARLDADDISYPARFRKQVEYLRAHPNVGVVSCWANDVTMTGYSKRCLCYPNNSAWIKAQFDQGTNMFPHSSAMYRRSLIQAFGRPYRTRYSQDFDLWLRLLPVTEFGIVEEVLVALRSHPNRISLTRTSQQIALHDLIYALYQKRKSGVPEGDWESEQGRILQTEKKTGSKKKEIPPELLYFAEAAAYQRNGERPDRVRDLLKKARAYPPLKKQVTLRLLLSNVPAELLSRMIPYTQIFARYRRYIRYEKRLKDILPAGEREGMARFWEALNGAGIRLDV